jgi:hypothetical protein
MIRTLVARFTLTTLAAIGCSPSSQPADSSQAETARTLEQAKARAQDLANSTQSYQPVRFVSAIEQVRAPRPVLEPKPDFVVQKGSDSVSADPIPMPATVQEDPAAVAQIDSSVQTPVARVPSIIPREAPLPAAVGGGTGDWRGNDPGPDMGTTIGVVLRGGRVDPGHCPRHPRPPSQIPNRIPRQ